MRKGRIAAMSAALVIAALLFTGIQTGNTYAAEGWIKSDGQWRHYDKDSRQETEVWRQYKDGWYYLGPDGTVVTNRFIGENGDAFYVGGAGRRLENQWFYNDAYDGHGHQAGWYYFGKDGKAYHKVSSRFIADIGDKRYAFDENGMLLTGWISADGIKIVDSDNPLETGCYFASESGELYTERWLKFSSMEVGAAAKLKSRFTDMDYNGYPEMWVYFGSDSKKTVSTGDRLKQLKLEGKTYAFDEYGVMLPWWSQVGTVSNADKSNPTTDVAPRFYSGDEGGALARNQWLHMYPSKNLDEKDFNDQKYSWWYTDTNGRVYQNKVAKIGGRYYGFDGLGRMQTGFVLYDGKKNFVGQYDPGIWEAKDFIFGNVLGAGNADLYFFSPDPNDGSMKTGNVEIGLSDGVRTFGFNSNGVSYGSRNRLQRVNDSYFINGLRLDGDKDYGYGVVETNAASGEYRLVNSNGNIVESRRNALKGKDGSWFIVINGCFAARVTDDEKPRWIDGDCGPGFYHYDKYSSNPYDGGFIAGYDTPARLKGLPSEVKLNFH